MSNVIVTGPGKCGGSLLMQILTELGVDTGFSKGLKFKSNDVGGNYEWPVRGSRMKKPFPYVIKEPQMCADIDLRIEKLKLEIDHIYILVRRPGPQAAALEFMRREASNKKNFEKGLNGNDLDKVTRAITQRIIQVIHLTAELNIPCTTISYPKFASDYKYFYNKLSYLVKKYNISYDTFCEKCSELIDEKQVKHAYDTQPEWVRATMREAWSFRGRL